MGAADQLQRRGSVDVDPDNYPGQPETASVGVPTVLSKLRKWGDYESIGEPVAPTPLLPMKTPLSQEILDDWQLPEPPRHSLTVAHLLESQSAKGRRVGCIIDLSNHDCLYKQDLPPGDGLEYRHLRCVAKELPSPECVQEVAAVVADFTARRPDDHIAIHCAYGFNRTGFVVVSLLVELWGIPVDAALSAFAAARAPGVKHERFRQELHRRYGGGDASGSGASATTGERAAGVAGGGEAAGEEGGGAERKEREVAKDVIGRRQDEKGDVESSSGGVRAGAAAAAGVAVAVPSRHLPRVSWGAGSDASSSGGGGLSGLLQARRAPPAVAVAAACSGGGGCCEGGGSGGCDTTTAVPAGSRSISSCGAGGCSSSTRALSATGDRSSTPLSAGAPSLQQPASTCTIGAAPAFSAPQRVPTPETAGSAAAHGSRGVAPLAPVVSPVLDPLETLGEAGEGAAGEPGPGPGPDHRQSVTSPPSPPRRTSSRRRSGLSSSASAGHLPGAASDGDNSSIGGSVGGSPDVGGGGMMHRVAEFLGGGGGRGGGRAAGAVTLPVGRQQAQQQQLRQPVQQAGGVSNQQLAPQQQQQQQQQLGREGAFIEADALAAAALNGLRLGPAASAVAARQKAP